MPPLDGPYTYYMGGFYGGTQTALLNMSELLCKSHTYRRPNGIQLAEMTNRIRTSISICTNARSYPCVTAAPKNG